MTTPTLTIKITDRNEVKFLFAVGFIGTPSPRDCVTLDFEFQATDELFEARKAFSLNRPVPVQSFIAASREVDTLIHEHRSKGGRP